MADPTPPVIDYSYSGFQMEQQINPFPGTQLDNDLQKLAESDGDIIEALKDVRRSDGMLKNGIVTLDSLDPTLKPKDGKEPFSFTSGPDYVFARDFVKMDGTDETVGLQRAFDAAKNKRLLLPTGMIKISSNPVTPGIVMDPDASYLVEGQSSFPGAGSQIFDTGTGRTLAIDASFGTPQADRSVILKNFLIAGNDLSDDGIYARLITNLQIRGVWVANTGGNGINLLRCFNSSVGDHTYVTRAGKYGIICQGAANDVVFERCRVIGNGRRNGYGNMRIMAGDTGTDYSRGVKISNCDLSYAGTNVYAGVLPTISYGLILNGVRGCDIDVPYVEQTLAANLTTYRAIYVDNSAAINIGGGGTIQDGMVEFAGNAVSCSMTGVNGFLRFTRPTGVLVDNAAPDFRYIKQYIDADSTGTPTFTWGTGTII
jgi:hypothetical protein